jgi:hypothetical protein
MKRLTVAPSQTEQEHCKRVFYQRSIKITTMKRTNLDSLPEQLFTALSPSSHNCPCSRCDLIERTLLSDWSTVVVCGPKSMVMICQDPLVRNDASYASFC